MTNEMEYTADDLRAAVERGEIKPIVAEYLLGAMERAGVSTLGQLDGYNTGVMADWGSTPARRGPGRRAQR